MQELNKILEEMDDEIEKQRAICEDIKDTSGWALYEKTMNRAKDIIRKHMNDGWVPVDERLPEDEAKKYIDEELNGIGYLYPCLLTYKSPITEQIHVVKFYYDIYDHWFVNAREDVCEKDRCIAWRPLPEPYRLEDKANE